MGSGMGMMGLGFLMMLMGLVVVAALIALIILAVVRLGGRQGPSDSARRILDERYARGEIADEEYQRMKRQLG